MLGGYSGDICVAGEAVVFFTWWRRRDVHVGGEVGMDGPGISCGYTYSVLESGG